MSAKVVMRQVNRYRWQIENDKGDVIQGDINVQNRDAAEMYVIAYISSFLNWDYEIKVLPEDEFY